MHIDLQICYAWFRLAVSCERAFFFVVADMPECCKPAAVMNSQMTPQ
ncbi:hypothetical protein [Cupriavidus sp. SK-3]|nr:hypothetical protein [Cupriavidus sp. SK-3]